MSEGKALGITAKREESFEDWYTQVILKSELADYSPVSGCMVFRSSGYAIWEMIQRATDDEFKKVGLQNVYFPLFIPERLLQKEKEHVKGFSPEVAWVTEAGDTKLEERLAIRPTSETIMYDVISKWIRSWRDLPLRLNQWNNVVRWEFKHPTPFLRGREFLWNEGHTAFATMEEAKAERDQILSIYKRITEDYLALPGLLGRKTEREKFAGGLESYSIEHLMPHGRAIQGPDFHFDGQNFANVFEITFVDRNEKKQYVWQNTFAISTREIGVMVATHSDDRGLVIPPLLAPIQVIIVPITSSGNEDVVLPEAVRLQERLSAVARVKLDDRDHLTPGKKFNEWELKGIPLRIELGPRDLKEGHAVLARRDTLEKHTAKLSSIESEVRSELKTIQENLLRRATEFLRKNTHQTASYETLKSIISEHGGVVQAPWCGSAGCEAKVKDETGAKIINIPLEQSSPVSACVYCGGPGRVIANFARSY